MEQSRSPTVAHSGLPGAFQRAMAGNAMPQEAIFSLSVPVDGDLLATPPTATSLGQTQGWWWSALVSTLHRAAITGQRAML